MDPVLETTDLTKSFDGTVANDGISLAIQPGEFHGIIGPNGAGKTTLFDTICGFLDPDSGQVRFDGEDITGLSPDAVARRGLVRTFQITAPFEKLTVRENLLAAYSGGPLSGLRIPRDRRAHATELLERLELDRVADRDAGDISGGQQKLLELARAMMLDPDCLLLDEPTASVNPSLQERVLEFLKAINDGGTTIVLIEHDMNVVADVPDRLSVLANGRLIIQGSFATVTDDPRVRDAYLGRTVESTSANGVEKTSHEQQVAVASHTTSPLVEGSPRWNARTATPIPDRRQGCGGEPARLIGNEIRVGYGNHRVIDDVSVRSHDGITCLFGPNGSGKSTLLKALAGIIPIWSGSIEFGDHSMAGLDAREFVRAGISMVPQDNAIFEGLTVKENLRLGATTETDDARVGKRIECVLDTFPLLEDELASTAATLSGGQQTMLGIGRAMMAGSDVFLLDEPTSSLAPYVVDDIFEMVASLVDDGVQIILVEQNVRKSLAYADHVYVLAQGAIHFDGSPGALLNETDLLKRYLGVG